MANEGSVEALLREVLIASASQSAELKALNNRVDGVQSDARESRDAARDILAQTRAQDLPAKVAELRGHLDASSTAIRSDLVNAINKVTTEVRAKHDEHEVRFEVNEDRLDKLESFRDRLDGARGLVGWLAKNAPWLLTVIFAGAAVLGFKDE